MTYVRRSRSKRSPQAMSGFLDDLVSGLFGGIPQIADKLNSTPSSAACIEQANADLKPFDDRINELARTWNPTGFYTVPEIRQLVGSTIAVIYKGQGAIDTAASSVNTFGDSLTRATSDLQRQVDRSLDYLDAANKAEAAGTRLVNAPGLKRWVLDANASASSAMTTAAVVGCMSPAWASVVQAYRDMFDVMIATTRATGAALLTAGEAVVKTAVSAYDAVPYVKLGLGALGAWLVYDRLIRGGRG